MMNILFSLFFWLFSFTWMGLLAITTLIFLPFFHYRKIHHLIPRPGFEFLARLATLGRFEIIYDTGFDPNRLSVFCMNHTNLLDAHSASTVIPTPFCGLMNAWQFKIPFYGWLMKHSRGIPVYNEDRGKILQHITEEASIRRSEEMSILVFPEAHRTASGKIGRFRKGVFLMARDAGYPVVPVAVRGMFDVNRKGSFKFTPGPVSVYVGSQVELRGMSDSEVDIVCSRFQETVASYVEQGGMTNRKEAVNA